MKILLTGPNSFSGKVVLGALIAKGHEITTISRTPIDPVLINRVTPIDADLSTITELPGKFDAIVHIAATSPNSGVTNEVMSQNNILATANMIKIGQQTGIKKFIFFSSISVYGDIEQEIITESTPINNPGVYGASKLMCEAMLREQNDFKSVAIRLPAIIGAGAARHWMALIIDMFKENKLVTIYNPKAKFNNAIHIQNLAKFVCHLLEFDFFKPFDHVNVASVGELEIGVIAEQIKENLGSSSNIALAPAKKLSFTISNQYLMSQYAFQPMDFNTAFLNYLNECKPKLVHAQLAHTQTV